MSTFGVQAFPPSPIVVFTYLVRPHFPVAQEKVFHFGPFFLVGRRILGRASSFLVGRTFPFPKGVTRFGSLFFSPVLKILLGGVPSTTGFFPPPRSWSFRAFFFLAGYPFPFHDSVLSEVLPDPSTIPPWFSNFFQDNRPPPVIVKHDHPFAAARGA